MIHKILNAKHLPVKQRLKNIILYINRKKGAERSWNKRHDSVLKKNDNYKNSCLDSIESKHENIWSEFRRNVDKTTLRICSNVSGKSDPRIVPEDIFVSDIEPSLIIDNSVNFLSNKSFYNRWFPKGIFPRDILHGIEGRILNADLEALSTPEYKELTKQINYPVVFKPNRNSYGGQGIHFVEHRDFLISLIEENNNFVVQEKINQHSFFKQFNPDNINSLRVYLYRSVSDNNLHILSVALRMGKDGSLDNETDGGIHCFVNKNGVLNGYAVDKFATKYSQHPNTSVRFDKKIPDFENLKKLAYEVGNKVFLARLIGLDMCYDYTGRWRVIEVNTKSSTIRFSQYGGQPFFGKFTDEVIEFCSKNHWALSSDY